MALILQLCGHIGIPPLHSPESASATVEKSLELAVSYSQTLSQWSYLVLAGSVALVLRDIKERHKNKRFRMLHLLFVPGWVCLIWSIYEGMRVHGAHVSYAMAMAKSSEIAIINVNKFGSSQQFAMIAGLVVFGVWLISVLCVWVFSGTDAAEVPEDVC